MTRHAHDHPLPVLNKARGASPFADVRGALLVAGLATVVGLGWAAFGDVPGGRWTVVHILTLGVLTPLVLGFTTHFGTTLTRTELGGRLRSVWLGVGVLAVLVGLPAGQRWAVAAGSSVLALVVLDALVQMHRRRRAAVGVRFAWIVQAYEWAHVAFLVGALLGALIGVGLLRGTWIAAGRLAHLHVNLLGWGGLTLLATLPFFGPTLVRGRIIEGADDRAARAMRWGAVGLAVAVVGLLLTALPGPAGVAAQTAAVLGLGLMTAAAVVVCQPVGRVAAASRRGGSWALVVGVTVWFPTTLAADAVVVATTAWRWQAALGTALGVGVLAQAIVATIIHVVPLLRPRDARLVLIARLEKGALTRGAVWNTATVLAVLAAAMPGTQPGVRAAAQALLGAVLVQLALAVAWPIRDGWATGSRADRQ